MLNLKNKKNLDELIEAFQTASKERGLLRDFLMAILTPAELEEIPKRLRIVKRLRAGETQRRIAEVEEVGVATIARGVREIQDPNNGFNKVLDKLD